MTLKNFRIQIILKILVLSLCLGLFLLFFQKEEYYLTAFMASLVMLSIYDLFRYIDKVNRNFSDFLSAIKFDDFNFNSPLVNKGQAFNKLNQDFRIINNKFLDIRAEKEANHQFLQTLVKHVEIGLLCVNGEGEVILMNPRLQKLLHKPFLVKFESLKKVNAKLWETLKHIQSGQKELIKLNIKNKVLQLSIQCAEIRLQEEVYRIISFQNIKNELEIQELDSWQKLIRILTHEIMNSVAPISSLSDTLQQILEGKNQLEASDISKLRNSLAVIKRRSISLLNFTESYRSLTRIPPPNFQEVRVKDLFDSVAKLFEADLTEANIKFEQKIESDSLSFQADPLLLEQVLINLLKNAIEAVKGLPNPRISMRVLKTTTNQISIEISDNGPGIPPDKLDKVFIPFFTTKETGSGIGLSLSRQITRMHQGSLEIQSEEGKGSIVQILI